MNFDTDAKTTDIILFNSRNLGALIVDERPHVREWDEPQFNIQNIAIEESYGFGVLHEGQAIAVARNVDFRGDEKPTPAGGRSSRWARTTRSSRLPNVLVGCRPGRRSARSASNALRTQCVSPRAAAEFRNRCRAGPGAWLGSPRWTRGSSLPVLVLRALGVPSQSSRTSSEPARSWL